MMSRFAEALSFLRIALEQGQKRVVLRVWNLRRELRGKHGPPSWR